MNDDEALMPKTQPILTSRSRISRLFALGMILVLCFPVLDGVALPAIAPS